MSVPLDSKVFPITTAINDDGHLEVGGCDVTSLAREFGTPLYVFDEATLRNQATGFLDSFRSRYPESRVVYACKAFINVPLARYLAGLGLGFDVVSGGEVAVLRAAGVDLATVDFHGNNKTPEEIAQGSRLGRRDLRDRQLPRVAPAGRSGGGGRTQATRPHPRLALHRPAHPPPHHHGCARQQVRLPHRDRRRRGGGPAGDGRAEPGHAGHPLPPRLAHLRTGAVHRGDRARAAVRSAYGRIRPGHAPLQSRWRLRHRLHRGRRAPRDRRLRRGHRRRAHGRLHGQRAASARADHRAGTLARRPCRGRRLHRRRHQGGARRPHLRLRGRRHGRQHPPRALRLALHRQRRQPRQRRSHGDRHHRREVLRVRRRNLSTMPPSLPCARTISSPSPRPARTPPPWPASTT